MNKKNRHDDVVYTIATDEVDEVKCVRLVTVSDQVYTRATCVILETIK